MACMWAGQRSRYSDWLLGGRSRDWIPVGARFSTPVQTGPEAHPASCTMGTRSFPGVKSSRGVTLTTHPLLVPWSRKGRAIPLLPLWAVRRVQSLSACTRVHFFFSAYVANVLTFGRPQSKRYRFENLKHPVNCIVNIITYDTLFNFPHTKISMASLITLCIKQLVNVWAFVRILIFFDREITTVANRVH